MKSGRELIEDYKTQIDLVSFLESDGFKIDHRKGLGAFITLRRDAETLVVFKDQANHYRYFNRNDSADKGTVVDYYASTRNLDLSKGSPDWPKLYAHMNEFIGYFPEQAARVKPTFVPRSSENEPTPVNRYLDLKPLTDTKYLNSRGLNDAVLHSFEFKGKIFNRDYLDIKTGSVYSNTAFPVENQNGFIGINIRNAKYNGIYGARQDGVWMSNVNPNNPPQEVFITEAPIDAISYHIMNPVRNEGDRLYIASTGSFSQQQINLIQHLINTHKPASVILGNDNDASGKKFNLALLGQLEPGSGNRVYVSLQKNAAEAILTIDCPKDSKVSPAEMISLIDEKINAGTPSELRRAEVFHFNSNLADGKNDRIQVTMPNTLPFLRRSEEFIRELREMSFVRLAEPKYKDFNLDLGERGQSNDYRLKR
nr:toprim domain-containing protein [uncultured Dyadobacter sp.]